MAQQPKIRLTKVAQLEGHKAAVYDFCINHKNQTIYSAGSDGYIVAWKLSNPENGTLVLKAEEAFYTINIDEKEQILYAGTQKGNLYIIDLKNSKLIDIKNITDQELFFIHRNNSQIVVGDQAGVLHVLDHQNHNKHLVGNSALRCIDHNSKFLALGSSDNSIYFLRKDDYSIAAQLNGHQNSVFALCFAGDDVLYSAGRDAHIKIWDILAYREIESVPAHLYQIKSLALQSELLISSSMDKTIKIWSRELELLKVIDFERNQGHTNCINKLEWLKEKMFVSCSDDRSLIVWQVEFYS